MLKSKTYTIPFKRKRKLKTDYKKRIKYISSNKPRIVLRITNNNLKIQCVVFDEDGDKVLATVNSTDLKNKGWKGSTGNISAAYLTGLMAGIKLKDKIKEGVIDIGLNSITKGTRIPAAIKGIVDSGIKTYYSKEIFPNEETISGDSISKFSNKLKKSNLQGYEKQFSKYLKKGFNPEDLPKMFKETKDKING